MAFPAVVAFFAASCTGSHLGSASLAEKRVMNVNEKKDVINFISLKEQRTPSLAVRGTQTRGIVASGAGSLVSLATDAIKKMIDNDKKKYQASYQFGLTDLYFYDQLSDQSAFDPVGMQFNGVKLTRTFKRKSGELDTAFRASFVLDSTNINEVINNSIFRLRVEDFQLKFARAKVPANKKKLNMDIEITIQTSYVNQEGVLFDNVVLGKFYFLLRDAPLDSTDGDYKKYYDSLKGQLLTGKSFIVPRSFGYHKENNIQKPGYSQGAYSVLVKITESSKNSFVSKLLFDNAGQLIDAAKDNANKAIIKKLPSGL